MLYIILSITFILLSSILIVLYFIVALGSLFRIAMIRKIVKTKEFEDAFIKKKYDFYDMDCSDYRHKNYNKKDLLSIVTVSDYTTDSEVRNKITKILKLLYYKKMIK